MCRLMFLFMYKNTYTNSCLIGRQCYMGTGVAVGFRLGCRCLIRQLFQGHAINHLESDTGVRIQHSCSGSAACRICDFQKVHIASYV
jgi:hypothetical protein